MMKKDLLNETGNRNVFRVPENFFEEFSLHLDERIDAYEAEKNEVPRRKPVHVGGIVLTMQSVRPLLYMAAMFTLLLFSIGLVMHYSSGKSDSLRAQESATEQNIPTAEDYLISNVGTYNISQYYVESEFTE
jgi:hypothetical protein